MWIGGSYFTPPVVCLDRKNFGVFDDRKLALVALSPW
jgi:hypothetical protein